MSDPDVSLSDILTAIEMAKMEEAPTWSYKASVFIFGDDAAYWSIHRCVMKINCIFPSIKRGLLKAYGALRNEINLILGIYDAAHGHNGTITLDGVEVQGDQQAVMRLRIGPNGWMDVATDIIENGRIATRRIHGDVTFTPHPKEAQA